MNHTAICPDPKNYPADVIKTRGTPGGLVTLTFRDYGRDESVSVMLFARDAQALVEQLDIAIAVQKEGPR